MADTGSIESAQADLDVKARIFAKAEHLKERLSSRLSAHQQEQENRISQANLSTFEDSTAMPASASPVRLDEVWTRHGAWGNQLVRSRAEDSSGSRRLPEEGGEARGAHAGRQAGRLQP